MDAKYPQLSLTASSVTLAVLDYSKYSLSERTNFHFLLTEALENSRKLLSQDVDGGPSETEEEGESVSNRSHQNACGIKLILECIPSKAKPTRFEKRALRVAIQRFNQAANEAIVGQRTYCHEPSQLPLKLNPSTRVFFVYQRTRIALLIDAAPTLLASYGLMNTGKRSGVSVPLDLIPRMVKIYLMSLVEPILHHDGKNSWEHELSISVMAVGSRNHDPSANDNIPNTLLLVRDYSLVDKESAEKLVQQLEKWLLSTVEEEIAKSMSVPHQSLLFADLASPIQQSSVQDWLEAGKATLSTMSSEARPLLVVATDCRAVASDPIFNILSGHIDVPLSIIHLGDSTGSVGNGYSGQERHASSGTRPSIANLMISDNGGAAFPLRISNDKEALCDICCATNGCFWDLDLLEEASQTRAGRVADPQSPFALDHFFAKRRNLHVNAIQWYSLFSLSPLTPSPNTQLGKPPPPVFRQKRAMITRRPSSDGDSGEHKSHFRAASSTPSRQFYIKSTFSTYVINPIRILGLLQLRIKQGYRAYQYGARTNDPDRVDILLALKLDSSTTLQYELSYKAIPDSDNHMVGSARIMIYLSGRVDFVESVKAEFVQSSDSREIEQGSSISDSISSRICQILRQTREEDMHQSYIVPTRWSNHLVKGAPFIKRLALLSNEQRLLHFRRDQFDCVCIGNMPYNDHTALFLNAFHDADNGENGLFTAFSEWSSQVVYWSQEEGQPNKLRFIKKLSPTSGGLASYCLVELIQSTSRTYTIWVESFASGGASSRLDLLFSIQQVIRGIKDVHYVEKQISPYLVSLGVHSKDKQLSRSDRHRLLLEKQHKHKSWDLIHDHEVLPLLIKRRVEIDNFYLLEEKEENYALLARIQPGEKRGDAGDLIQYQILKDHNRVVVHLHMESEAGVITGATPSMFWEQLVSELESTDIKCGRALRARTNILSNLDHKDEGQNLSGDSIRILLPYCSTTTLRLPFFNNWSPSANAILKQMLQGWLMSHKEGAQLAKLSVDREDIDGFQGGEWFIVKYDSETMSLLHLSTTTCIETSKHNGTTRSFRALQFCTISTADLYFTRRADVGIEEYMSVSALSETIESAHKAIYPMAAYAAIQRDEEHVNEIHPDDFLAILQELGWVEITRVVVERGSSKLVSLIKTLLSGVKGEQFHLYYRHEKDSNNRSLSRSTLEGDTVESLPSKADSPLLFRFLVDNGPSTANALARIKKSSNVSVMVSVRKDHKGPLPEAHRSAGVQLSRLLTSYTAAQTLERLRFHGSDITDDDLYIAKICLRRVMEVETDKVLLSFYSSKFDDIIQIRASDTEEENAVRMFDREMKCSSSLKLKAAGTRGLLIIGRGEHFIGELPYWCFINTSLGVVSLHVWHPGGVQAAKQVVSEIREEVLRISHRVNQLLLLHHMHSSRTASRLICPEEQNVVQERGNKKTDDAGPDGGSLSPGYFACPVTFTYTFNLFHMCAANPKQVAAALESTVLHIFSLSNRRSLYVYKDEEGKILYMYLQARDGEQGTDGSLTLVVHGVEKPNETVTGQLVRLLSKRILALGLDMLSLSVTKNPFRKWKDLDLDFVRQYAKQWQMVDDSRADSDPSTEKVYCLSHVFDPGMLILYIRQNLAGSSYFQPLATSHEEDTFDFSSACFYFNNSPSKLNNSLQGQSTLTERGEEYRQQAGTGLAIIEVSLINARGHSVEDLGFGHEIPEWWKPSPSARAVEEHSSEMPPPDTLSDLRLKIKIEDTALKTEVLHQWIKMTLDQVIAGWVIERHIELSCVGHNNLHAVPLLTSLLEESNNIPHPGARKVETSGIMRSRNLATNTFQMLESAILAPIYKEARSLSKGLLERYLLVVRKTEQSSEVVRFRWRKGDRGERKASVIRVRDGKESIIEDQPVDLPEYCISCILPGWQSGGTSNLPLLFRDVSVQRDEHEALKGKGWKISPFAFHRSFAFIFIVKRNTRTFYTYNWDPGLLKATRSLLQEEESSFLRSLNAKTNRLQRNVLGMLSPKTVTSTRATPDVSAAKIEDGEGLQHGTKTSRRPIRRPKLIGKSIEGAAAHALAASRARASFKGNPAAPSPAQRTRSQRQPPKQRPEESNKRTPRLSKEASKVAKIQKEIVAKRSLSVTMARQHTLHNWIARAFADPAFQKGTGEIFAVVAEYLLHLFPLSLTLVFRVPPAPRAIIHSILESVGRSLCSRTNEFVVTPVLNGAGGEDRPPSILLTSVARKLFASKVLCCLKLEVLENRLVCRIFTLTMKRKARKRSQKSKFDQATIEKDAAGSDVLSLELIPESLFEGSLFDCFAGAVIGSLSSSPLVLDDLLANYSFSRQLRALHSGFKVFRLPLLLASYQNPLLSNKSITPEMLFGWLKANESETGLSNGPPGYLLVRRDLAVRRTHSSILLSCDKSGLSLTLVCRTNGRDLNEAFFPQNQSIARTISSSIGIEAAGVVYHELVVAATNLHCNNLWRKSTKPSSIHARPTDEELNEMISLGNNEPIGFPDNGLFEALSDDLELMCESIFQDERFSPSYKFVGPDGSSRWLFYFADGLFLLAQSGANESRVHFSVLSRVRPASETTESLSRKLSNFLLHQTWSTFLI